MSSLIRDSTSVVYRCEWCGSTEHLRRCGRCHGAYYCCRDHQREHWSIHRSVCRITPDPSSQGSFDEIGACGGQPRSELEVFNVINTQLPEPNYVHSQDTDFGLGTGINSPDSFGLTSLLETVGLHSNSISPLHQQQFNNWCEIDSDKPNTITGISNNINSTTSSLLRSTIHSQVQANCFSRPCILSTATNNPKQQPLDLNLDFGLHFGHADPRIGEKMSESSANLVPMTLSNSSNVRGMSRGHADDLLLSSCHFPNITAQTDKRNDYSTGIKQNTIPVQPNLPSATSMGYEGCRPLVTVTSPNFINGNSCFPMSYNSNIRASSYSTPLQSHFPSTSKAVTGFDYPEKSYNKEIMKQLESRPADVPVMPLVGSSSSSAQVSSQSNNRFHRESLAAGHSQQWIEQMSRNIIHDLNVYGICVIDNFLGKEKGDTILKEVKGMYVTGLFQKGQLVSTKAPMISQSIRGDHVTWVDGSEPYCETINYLMEILDRVISCCNGMPNNGLFSKYKLCKRTQAMVACYPGKGTHYVKHVDNPNQDGRCITSIYYLNKGWNVKENGGLLRMFPAGHANQVVDIEPIFDRILFFWSDRRNPHEVQPAHAIRFAITVWYFDLEERNQALLRFQEKKTAQHARSQIH
ncbi:uncharacterized protein LOC106472691 [Limulus polyphemus]|uniref:hypoxia-inducible factor-proline dioxygenase n=1 Tax=Limulus polyphemus TaxID=6850 RepID=A0ABM1BUB2_LIMPO|nr:uncharacterized protein LOC106472691 [Limulus polyphemus]